MTNSPHEQLNILDISELDVWYKPNDFILRNFNLTVRSGQVIGLLGRNGQGKTTLLNTIAGVHHLCDGNIQIMENQNISDITTKRLRYYIQDTPVLFEEMSPIGYFKFLHELYRKELDYDKLDYLQHIFDFKEYAIKRISTLSLGNRQKTNIIGGLLLRMPLLLLDEPLNGLDILSVEALYKELKLYVSEGNAAILSSHIIDILPQICTDVVIIGDGRIRDRFTMDKEINLRNKLIEVYH